MTKLTPDEHDICTAIIDFLNISGKYFCWRVNSGKLPAFDAHGKKRMIQLARKGTSDIQGIVKKTGRMFCLEVKKPTTLKTLTFAQQEYLQKMQDYGAITGVVTSPEQADALLRAAEKGNPCS